MDCLGNICINTLYKGNNDDDEDDDDDNNNNNNNNNTSLPHSFNSQVPNKRNSTTYIQKQNKEDQ